MLYFNDKMNKMQKERMKHMKRCIAFLLCLVMAVSLMPATVFAAPDLPQPAKTNMVFREGYTYYAISSDQITDKGYWLDSSDTQNSFRKTVMHAKGSGEPATFTFKVPKDGYYYIHGHARDYETMQPATRTFKILVDGTEIGTYGTHKTQGYAWESRVTPRIKAGEHTMTFVKNSAHARFDMLFVTDDPEFIPENTEEALLKLDTEYLFDISKIDIIKEDKLVGRPNSEIAVKFNDEWITFDVEPTLMNDRTMVPFRAIFEALGCTVSWNDDTQTASGTRNGVKISLPIGEKVANVNGKGQALDQPAVVVNDRTLVPLRFVSEALNADVEWDGDSNTVFIYAIIPKETVLITSDSYTDVGTWSITGIDDTLTSLGMYGTTPGGLGATEEDADASNTKPAMAPFSLTKDGTYNVWVRARDYAVNKPGTRYFQIGFDGNPMWEQKFGTHGAEGFQWVLAGPMQFKAGEHQFYLYDTSGFYARCDSILITEDLDYIPAEDYKGITSVALPFVKDAVPATKGYPKYAREQAEPTESYTIENNKTKVVFYKVPTSGGVVVQNEIYSKANGEWIKTNNRDEQLGYLVMHADNAEIGESQNVFSIKADYTYKGQSDTVMTSNPYSAGAGLWYIPDNFIAEGNKVTLYFPATDYGTLTATWTLDDTNAPKVSVDMTFAKDGYFSIGAFEGDELDTDDVEYILAPFRYQYKRIPEDPELLSEMYLFTPMGTYTLYENNKYTNKAVTKGVTAEPSWIPIRWVKAGDSLFGMTVKGQNNMPQGGMFAPVLGNPDSKKTAGESYNLQYRVISSVSDWFSTYDNVITNLFGVTDYRKNYTVSLNQAIFNTRDLMKDDQYGGWDPIDKAHYNIEGMNVTSTGNSMQALQDYLLTEDEDLLDRRTIPTLANTLSRKEIHFNRTGIVGGGTYWAQKDMPDSIGEPIKGFNANVMGGMYEMTHGSIPFLHEYTLEKGQTEVTNSYGSIASFANDLSMYKYTGEQKYLDSAIQKADKYLAEQVWIEDTTLPDWVKFIYISYYPNLASLIDIYEVTKDKKYLDAAEYVAQWMSTGLWVPGVDGTRKTDPFWVNDVNEIVGPNPSYYNPQSNWQGNVNYRVGGNSVEEATESNKIIENLHKQVEGWVAARTGLGIEQASTFKGGKHIIMQSFVGDFLKLAGYTNNDYYAKIARNSMLGRFSTYAGYYRSDFMTYDQETDYARFGPDETGMYWHHIPPFLAMMEEFLITQAFAWSNTNIEFPSLRQQGYAYFNSNQYGHESGKFYDEDDMWLWIDEGIINPDSIQVDWIAAKKDGVLGIALMNEEHADLTTTVTLGDKVPGGASYSGTATLYDENGKVGTVEVVNGKFTVTLPKQGLMAVKMNIPGVKKPSYANIKYSVTEAEVGATVSEHTNGRAYTLQMSGDNYYAYVYVSDMGYDTMETFKATTGKPGGEADVKSLTMTYSIGDGQKQTVTTSQYPFEFLIKVDDVNAQFNYELTVTKADGTTETRGKGILKSVMNENYKEGGNYGPVKVVFDPVKIDIKTKGRSATAWRYVVSPKHFGIENLTEGMLTGVKVKATYTHKENPNDVLILDSVVLNNEMRADGNITLVIAATEEVSIRTPDGELFDDNVYNVVAEFYPAE